MVVSYVVWMYLVTCWLGGAVAGMGWRFLGSPHYEHLEKAAKDEAGAVGAHQCSPWVLHSLGVLTGQLRLK